MTLGITQEKAEDAHMEMLAHMEIVVVVHEQLIQQLTLTKSACAAAEVFAVTHITQCRSPLYEYLC